VENNISYGKEYKWHEICSVYIRDILGGIMKIKKIAISALMLGLILSLAVLPCSAAQKEIEKKSIIPPEVMTVLKTGIQTREARADIPFTIIQNIYLPARENLHSVFLFECKNADIGYVSSVPAQIDLPEKKDEEKSSFEVTPAKLTATGHAFLLFSKMEKGIPGELVKEVYIPYKFMDDGAEYDAEKVEFYSTGYPLPAGDYLLSMALCSQNLEKIGTQYCEFSLPNEKTFVEKLETTPIFFAKDIQRMQAVETRSEIHKGYFTYSILKIEPNISKVLLPEDNLDVFFYIFGTSTNAQGQYDIDVEFEVVQGDKMIIKYATQKYPRGPIISQPLPLIRTVKITSTDKDGNKTERTEQNKLDSGTYVLKIKTRDNISGNSVEKSIQFEVK